LVARRRLPGREKGALGGCPPPRSPRPFPPGPPPRARGRPARRGPRARASAGVGRAGAPRPPRAAVDSAALRAGRARPAGGGASGGARRPGWAGGWLRGRLERGRKRLHERLARRGLTLSAALGLVQVARAARVAPGLPAAWAAAAAPEGAARLSARALALAN